MFLYKKTHTQQPNTLKQNNLKTQKKQFKHI